MTFKHIEKTPWPYFGGKADAASAVWSALGDVHHYVEPFFGSGAVLLRRPHVCNRAYYSETVNDIDGLLVNAWRSIVLSPDETAEHASWPVSEADLHARHLMLVRWRAEEGIERLMGDPLYHVPVFAGWWIWGSCCWIGSGWASGDGPWTVDAGGRLWKQGRSAAREPGVHRQIPFLSYNGQGVNSPAAREPGVAFDDPITEGTVFHQMTMPEITRWMQFLSARLRHVRILNGDWQRACTTGATKTLPVRSKSDGVCGVFLDPPYSGKERCKGLYACEAHDIGEEVLGYCIKHGPDPKMRIVLAGFDTEHADLESHGWRVVEWYKAGFLKGGMGNVARAGSTSQQHRERLWLSPHCLAAEDTP